MNSLPTRQPTDELRSAAAGIIANVESVIDGKNEAVLIALTVLMAEGHLLIEDVPGVGKTMLAKALAKSLGVTMMEVTPSETRARRA